MVIGLSGVISTMGSFRRDHILEARIHDDRADGPDGRPADEIDLKQNLGYYISIQKADWEPSRSWSRSIRF